MNRKNNACLVVILALMGVLAAWPARGAAQDVEIGAQMGFNFPNLVSSYNYSYVPPFPYKPYTGLGSIAFDLKSQSAGLGYGGFINIAMRDHWLFQLSYTHFSTVLVSPVTSYTLGLQYTASSPAGTPPRPFTYSSTVDWPELQGEMKNTVFSLDLIYRIGSTGGLALDLLGGLSYFHFSGSYQSLAVTRFNLDADGGLTSEEFGLAVTFGPKYALGANGGLGLTIHFNSNFGLFVEGRYYYCPAIQTSTGYSVITLADQTAISLSSVNFHRDAFKVNGSFLGLQSGLKVMF